MGYKNAWEEYKAKNSVTPIDLFIKNNYIEKIESDKRMQICLNLVSFYLNVIKKSN